MNAMTSAISCSVSVVFQDGMYALLPTASASFGYHGGQIFVGHCLDVAFAGKRPDMWHEALAATPAVRAVTALAILQEDSFAVPRISGRNRRR